MVPILADLGCKGARLPIRGSGETGSGGKAAMAEIASAPLASMSDAVHALQLFPDDKSFIPPHFRYGQVAALTSRRHII